MDYFLRQNEFYDPIKLAETLELSDVMIRTISSAYNDGLHAEGNTVGAAITAREAGVPRNQEAEVGIEAFKELVYSRHPKDARLLAEKLELGEELVQLARSLEALETPLTKLPFGEIPSVT